MSPEGKPVVELNGVGVRYEGEPPVDALSGATLAIRPGSVTAVVGRSGSGKSTLVSVMALLRTPTSGTLTFHGQSVTAMSDSDRARLRAHSIGVVFQAFHLEPNLTARENVMLPWFSGASALNYRAATKQAEKLLEMVDLPGLGYRYKHQLSGGQRQRVAIARALFQGPTLLLADEPTGNLDEESAGVITDLLVRAATSVGTSVVIVTHDHAVAARADHRFEIASGQVARMPVSA